jgi:hypothetical protein
LGTVQTEIAEAQNSGSVRHNTDVDFVDGISLKDIVDMALVLQTDMQTLGIDINMRKSLTCFTDNGLQKAVRSCAHSRGEGGEIRCTRTDSQTKLRLALILGTEDRLEIPGCWT